MEGLEREKRHRGMAPGSPPTNFRLRIFEGHLFKNLLVLAGTITAGVFLARSGILERVLLRSAEWELAGSFIAGIFFTSLFTAGPATVALGTIARENSIFIVAFAGGAGAVIGDLILLRFMKNYLTEEFFALFGRMRPKRLGWLFRMRMFRWFLTFVGALIIALPLPDEIGLALMGLAHLKAKYLVPLSFVLNTVGIFFVGLVARAL